MKINSRRIELLLIDLSIITATFYLISLLNTLKPGSLSAQGGFSAHKLLLFVASLLCVRIIFRVYRNIWRYASAETYLRLIAADTVAGLFTYIVGLHVPKLSLGFAYTSEIAMTVLIITLCTRCAYQYLYAYRNRQHDNNDDETEKTYVVIIGAGNVGAALAATLLRNPKANYLPYAFIDIDPQKIGNTINGLPVYANDDRIVNKIKNMPVRELILAIPDMKPEDKMREFAKFKETGCQVKIYDYPTSERRAGVTGSIREMKIEDLLFRQTISYSNELTNKYYSGKTVLVTGGGGSIGSELCRQIAKQSPAQLIILDIYENNAYDIQQELVRTYGSRLNLRTVIASVRDIKRMDEIFRTFKPEIVIHAAAHKHVPLMEDSASEAVKNNVLGTYNTANMAEKYGAKKFLLISTDKAVNPTNVMGASKRLCEMVLQCRTDSATEFAAVRFGNVLGSNGSVVPLFKKQIAAGGPVTVTHREMTRFFMTISEAVQLVLEAGSMAKSGELFVLDMGKPVKIFDLAESMIRLSGLRPGVDIEIKEIGLRPGEKLYEELLMQNENLKKTANNLIFIEKDRCYSRREVDEKLAELCAAVDTDSNSAVHDAIRRTVPTFLTPDEANSKRDTVQV